MISLARYGLLTVVGLAGVAAFAQPATAQTGEVLARERARLEAERQAQERAAREQEPEVSLPEPGKPVLGPFPEEHPCFVIERLEIEGAERRGLRWVARHLDQYRGRCVGAAGLDHILKSLQAAFLDRGLVTTRAGLPEQDFARGTLKVVVVPGVASGVRTNGQDGARTWEAASPIDAGDLITLRGLEQGLEQLRRVPGREVNVDMTPGEGPGDTVLDVTLGRANPFSASFSINNFAGPTVGRWQGSGQLAVMGLLGFSEVVSLSYNQRVKAPGIPANSKGSSASVSVPAGWWTLGASASANRHGQRVIGEVASFETRGKLSALSAYGERVIHRDQVSKSAARLTLSRRWGRNFIDDIEIGIQRQDLSDIELALSDRRSLGLARLDSMISLRVGTDWFGAQEETADRPQALPTARYRIFSADFGLTVPLRAGVLESWRADFHGQFSHRNLYGSDTISVGGPYTVRGLDSDTAELGRSGWFVRQELGLRIADQFRPYALFDAGAVHKGSGVRGGLGLGLRTGRGPFSLDAFAARPAFGKNISDRRRARFGVSAAMGF
ncbi:ShlB/FhaC/HecB family hemolysin secretion/activation protein [Croceibacterium sp. LX-88]|uniref:ShlB/FhaC/HecB family hemolysin secretion/activation protein n=1 Tax=Croceibacterium selenioxidans TaxID=2838833 RepID=A0ABS5W4S3_9SPHN|nr:ShlB/FhaC/HecB family hemolysin secretion/activation protein [Croceibacterium selenioxidans]